MIIMTSLLHFIRSLTAFSDESWDLLQPALEKRKFKQKEFLLKHGEICKSLYYIESGYGKSYYEIDGEIKNTGFFFENEISTNIGSFANGQESEFNIVACEDLEVIIFKKDILLKIARESIEIESLGKCCLRLFAIKQEELLSVFQRFTAEERLNYLETQKPQILQRVSLSQLASFLGVTRETLSRIRRRRIM